MNLINKKSQLNSRNYSNTVQSNSGYAYSGNLKSSRKLKLAEKFFDFLISFSLFFIFFGIATFSTGFSFQGIAFDKQMALFFWTLLMLIAWIAKSIIKGEMNIRRTPLDIPIAIFWFAYFLSTIFSIDKWHSFWGFSGNPTHGLANITASVVLYYVIMSNFNIRRLRIALGAFIFSGLLIVVKEILEINRILDFQNSSFLEAHHWVNYLYISAINPTGSTTGTSIFISVLIIILIAVFIKTKSSEMAKVRKIFLESIFLAMIVASLYLLLALYYFVPWPGILIGVGFFLIFILARVVKIEKKSDGWLPISIFVFILIIMMIGGAVVSSFGVVKNKLPTEVSLTSNLSWQILKGSIMKNNFFIGSGPGTYGYDFSLYKPQDFNINVLYGLRFNEGSGIFWEMLPTLGILGTFSYILLLASFLSMGIYLLSRKSGGNKIYSLGLMASVLLILVDSLFMQLDASIIILGILLAIFTFVMVLAENDAEEEYLKFSLKASPKYALISAFVLLTVGAGTIFLVVFLVKIYVADIFAGIAGKQKSSGEASIKMIEKAIDFNSNEGKYYTFGGQQYMALANSEFLKGEKADRNLFENYLDSAIVFTSKGKELMPKDITAVESFAQALENKSLYSAQFFDQAISAYNDALALEPHNAMYFLKIGKIYAMQATLEKDENTKKTLIEKAKEWFQKATDEKNNLAEAQFQLGSMQQILGEKDNAVLSLQKAISLDNSNADYFLMLANAYQSRGTSGDYENAENIYKNIISVQGDDINTHLSLGLLYEKMKRFVSASEQYKKVSDLLPQGNKDAKTKIQKMISNADQGIENTAENLKDYAATN